MADSIGIDLSPVLGPAYWGFILSFVLTGVTCVQAYSYFTRNNDPLRVGFTAAAMLILDLTSSVLIAQSIYYYLIPHFGSIVPLGAVTPELSAECLLSGIITLLSQLYFVHQLYTVRSVAGIHWSIVASIAVLAMLAFAGGTGCVAAMYIHSSGVLSNRSQLFSIFFGLAKGLGALTDIIATISMCYFLSHAQTGMKRTNSILRSLMKVMVNRGVLVTLIQVLLLITFFAIPDKLYWFSFHLNVTKLYANTFFAMLNSRESIQSKSSTGSRSNASRSIISGIISQKQSRAGHADASESQIAFDVPMGNLSPAAKHYNMPAITKTVDVYVDRSV